MLSIIALVVALIALFIVVLAHQKRITREITLNDDVFRTNNGVLYGRGFAAEEGTFQVTDEKVTSKIITDGKSVMTDGNIIVEKRLKCNELKNEFMTSKNIHVEDFWVNGSFSAPSKCSQITIVEMDPLSPNKEWQRFGKKQKNSLFIGERDFLEHVTLERETQLRFQDKGKWRFAFTLLIESEKNNIISVAFASKTPLGFGCSFSNGGSLNGNGIIKVDDEDDLYSIWIQTEQEIRILRGTLTLEYLGR